MQTRHFATVGVAVAGFVLATGAVHRQDRGRLLQSLLVLQVAFGAERK
jgi:hypothetical protein